MSEIKNFRVILDLNVSPLVNDEDPFLWAWKDLLDLHSEGESVTAHEPRVFVATWDHRSGRQTAAFLSMEGAKKWRREIAEEWWDVEMSPDDAKPVDPDEMADFYFERMGSRGDRGEWCEIVEIELEN